MENFNKNASENKKNINGLDEETLIRTENRGNMHKKFEELLQRLLGNLEIPNHADNWITREQFLKDYAKNKERASEIRAEMENLKKDSNEYELKTEELEDISIKNNAIAKYILKSLEDIDDKDSILFRDKMYNMGVSRELLRSSLDNASSENDMAKKYKLKWLLGYSDEEQAEREKQELDKKNENGRDKDKDEDDEENEDEGYI